MFEVQINRYKGPGFLTECFSINVIADGLDEAVELGKDYAELCTTPENWGVYEVVSASLKLDGLFLGLEEEFEEFDVSPDCTESCCFPSGEERSI